MKILFVDRFLKGKPHADWKEGFSLYYAAKLAGIDCDIAGKDCAISENQITEIASKYDLIVVSENYPNAPSVSDGKGWSWWNWKDIKTPKLFWAIDTHVVNYRSFIIKNNFDYVALNNKKDIKYYGKRNFFGKTPGSFFMPLAIQKDFYSVNYAEKENYDISFIGSIITKDRQYYVNKYKMNHQKAFGFNYIKAMQESKICFNLSISYDLNCKYFEILGSGSFLLSNNPNDVIYELFDRNLLSKCIWKSEADFEKKLMYYLHNEDERKSIAHSLREYILDNHTYQNRINLIINQIKL